MKRFLIMTVCVLSAAAIAILVHMYMPSPGSEVNVSDFDSVLVNIVGFPFVATMYFVVLYLHILIIMYTYGSKSALSTGSVGLRMGFAFGAIYLVCMQEVVMSSSPFDNWGADFVVYQLFMGIGEAVPAVIICVIFAAAALPALRKKYSMRVSSKAKDSSFSVVNVIVIAIALFAERCIGYYTGIVASDIRTETVPVLVWTVLFGVVMGVAYELVILMVSDGKSLKQSCLITSILIIGINWMWFNSFIALIFADTIGPMLIRSLLDIAVLSVSGMAVRWLRKKLK